MTRLPNRDVDDLIRGQYEEALMDDEPWAVESHDVHRWAALDGKRVRVESDEGGAEGIWRWKGQTAEDFWLVYIVHPAEGYVILGTDPRNFTSIEIVGGEAHDSE
jgi:hypothetical protein